MSMQCFFFSENLKIFFCLQRAILDMCLLYALHLANFAYNTWTSAEHIFVTFVTLVLFVNTFYFSSL
jgi:heme/copper-type cytochrome/quinol oxidase subunit 4